MEGKADANGFIQKNQRRGLAVSHRSLILAIRFGLADWENGIDMEKMLAAIENGEVWKMRGVGEKTIQEWSNFIVQKRNENSQPGSLSEETDLAATQSFLRPNTGEKG